MIMLYNSDNYTVLKIELADSGPDAAGQQPGGFEIVDKLARTGIFIGGDLAAEFQQQALALAGDVDAERLDAFIAGYTELGAQPMVLH
jgi:hypothetical protein